MNPFVPHPRLRNGHVMTVFAWGRKRLAPKLPPVETRLFDVAADTRVSADCFWQPDRARFPALIVLHGLEGSSAAHYMTGIAEKAYAAGFNAVLLNQRNCGGTENLSPGLYHSGLTHDAIFVMNEICTRDGVYRVVVAGYSLGGNLALKLAGDFGTDAPRALRAVCAVSPILEISKCVHALERPLNIIYQWNFVKDLRARMRRKAALYPGAFPIERLPSVRTVRQFDEIFTAPYFKFKDAEDYYHRASAMRVVRRDADPADHAHRAGAVVVVLGILELEVRRGEDLVELPHRPYRREPFDGKGPRIQGGLASHPRPQVLHEIPLIDDVERPLERVDAVRDLEDRRHGAHCPQRARRVRAEISRQLQREVSSQRVAGDDDAVDAVARADLVHHKDRIVRQPRVIEAGREVLGAAAVALVQEHGIESCGVCLFGDPRHVMRGARALETVQHDERREPGAVRLPEAVRRDARIGGNIEEARLDGRQFRREPLAAPREDGHDVPVAQARMRNEWVHSVQAIDVKRPGTMNERKINFAIGHQIIERVPPCQRASAVGRVPLKRGERSQAICDAQRHIAIVHRDGAVFELFDEDVPPSGCAHAGAVLRRVNWIREPSAARLGRGRKRHRVAPVIVLNVHGEDLPIVKLDEAGVHAAAQRKCEHERRHGSGAP